LTLKLKPLESGARTTFFGPCHQATPSKLDMTVFWRLY